MKVSSFILPASLTVFLGVSTQMLVKQNAWDPHLIDSDSQGPSPHDSTTLSSAASTSRHSLDLDLNYPNVDYTSGEGQFVSQDFSPHSSQSDTFLHSQGKGLDLNHPPPKPPHDEVASSVKSIEQLMKERPLIAIGSSLEAWYQAFDANVHIQSLNVNKEAKDLEKDIRILRGSITDSRLNGKLSSALKRNFKNRGVPMSYIQKVFQHWTRTRRTMYKAKYRSKKRALSIK